MKHKNQNLTPTRAAFTSKRTKRKILLLIIEIFILLLLSIILFVVTKLSKIQKNDLNLDNVAINEGLSPEAQEVMSEYTTIALFGLDNRSNGNLLKGRSDVIMLANINDKTKEVQLVSVYRDSFLDTGNGIYQKANAAYAKGGPEQALSMLNTNLDLAITNYVTVDFNAIVECIDLLGGIELTITDQEAILMDGYILEINKLTGNNSKRPPSGGTYTLDGVQATAYARIRATAGDDYKRTERQREVLAAMVKKAQKSNLKTINSVINQVFGDIETSFSNVDLISLASKLFSYKISDTSGFPFQKNAKRLGKTGDVVIPCDLSTNVTELHRFLFNATDYTPSDTVQSNSDIIIQKTGFRAGDGY